jgi:hypothetical protein
MANEGSMVLIFVEILVFSYHTKTPRPVGRNASQKFLKNKSCHGGSINIQSFFSVTAWQ